MAAQDELAALLGRTAEAHHQAYIATDGVDPNWTAWYARYLLDNGFGEIVPAARISVDDLARLLVEADRQHRSQAPEAPWEPYYAERLLARAAG